MSGKLFQVTTAVCRYKATTTSAKATLIEAFEEVEVKKNTLRHKRRGLQTTDRLLSLFPWGKDSLHSRNPFPSFFSDTPDATADCGRRQSSTASRMLNMKVFKSNKIKNIQHFNVI